MRIGIRTHDLVKGTIDEVISSVKEAGFENLQLVFKKALVDENNKTLVFSKDNAIEVAKKLKENNINVAMLGAYFNPVHSNKELVEQNTCYFEEHLKYASLFDCNYVGTETGSYNDDKWTYNPKNQTEEGYQESLAVFKRLEKTAKEYKTTILMEPAWGHVMYCTKQLKRAVDELNSEYVKVTIDIYNLLYIDNYKNYKEIFTEALQTFNKNIKVIHLKDFNVILGKLVQCGLGKGIIDFNFIIGEVKKYCPDATLVFEGVVGKDIQTSLKLIKGIIEGN